MAKPRKKSALARGAIVPLPARVTSRRHARKLTSQYHAITHRLAAAASDDERAACRADLEKMGGVGDLGDSAAAYGCNDWGASAVTDGANEFADNDGDGIVDAAQKGKDAASQAGHIDQYTYGDMMADKAEAAKAAAILKMAKFEEAKRKARGFFAPAGLETKEKGGKGGLGGKGSPKGKGLRKGKRKGKREMQKMTNSVRTGRQLYMEETRNSNKNKELCKYTCI